MFTVKPDATVLRAVVQLDNDSLDRLMSFLEAERSVVLETMVKVVDGDAMRRLQGRAECLSDVVQLVRTAGDTLNRIDSTG